MYQSYAETSYKEVSLEFHYFLKHVEYSGIYQIPIITWRWVYYSSPLPWKCVSSALMLLYTMCQEHMVLLQAARLVYLKKNAHGEAWMAKITSIFRCQHRKLVQSSSLGKWNGSSLTTASVSLGFLSWSSIPFQGQQKLLQCMNPTGAFLVIIPSHTFLSPIFSANHQCMPT